MPALPQGDAALADGGGRLYEEYIRQMGMPQTPEPVRLTGGLPQALGESALPLWASTLAQEYAFQMGQTALPLYQEYFRNLYGVQEVQPAVPLLPEWSGGGWEGLAEIEGGALMPMFPDTVEASLEAENRREFVEFQGVLGDDAPKSLAEFLDLKYNNPDTWMYLKTKKEQTIFVEQAPCVTTPKKYTGFFLKPEAKHSQDFFGVGYTQDNPLQLRYDMARQFDMSKAVNYQPVAGKKGVFTFNIYMMLGINSKKRFRTCWQIDVGTEKPRIITAFRDDKE